MSSNGRDRVVMAPVPARGEGCGEGIVWKRGRNRAMVRKLRGTVGGLAGAVVLFGLLVLSLIVPSIVEAALVAPSGFTVEQVLAGLVEPVAISFATDGRMFVAEKRGVIRVYKNGTLLPTPFVDISAEVNNYFEHGMVGMTLHPDFPAVPYVYVLYTYDPPGVAKDAPGARVSRVERIEADPFQSELASSNPFARTVLVGRNGDASTITDPTTTPSLSCWRNGARVEDCIPTDSYRHAPANLRFGPEGALYVGTGDADRLPGGPLDPASWVGAILRVDPASGNGLADNPFYNGNPASNISKTWVYGLRNPYRFSFDPGSGELLIGDVGQDAWEAIHRGSRGTNYGWPCYEGGSHLYPVYQNTALCQGEYARGPRPPIYSYGHTQNGGAITAGEWYHGTTYPAAYRGAHFFADYSQGWIKYLAPDGSGGYSAHDFAADAPSGGLTSGIVQLRAGPDTNLYWTSVTNGAVYRLRYTGAGNAAPTAVASAEPSAGAAPLSVSFRGRALRPRRAAPLLPLGLRGRRQLERRRPQPHLRRERLLHGHADRERSGRRLGRRQRLDHRRNPAAADDHRARGRDGRHRRHQRRLRRHGLRPERGSAQLADQLDGDAPPQRAHPPGLPAPDERGERQSPLRRPRRRHLPRALRAGDKQRRAAAPAAASTSARARPRRRSTRSRRDSRSPSQGSPVAPPSACRRTSAEPGRSRRHSHPAVMPSRPGRTEAQPPTRSSSPARAPATPPASPRAPLPARPRLAALRRGCGTLARDASGQGDDAQLLNGAGWGAGHLGGSLVLDGVDDIAAVSDAPGLGGLGQALTVAAWVQRTTAQSGWRLAASRQLTTTSADQFYLGFNGAQPRFGLNTSGGGNQNTGAGSVNPGEWVHLAGVYDGSAIRLYLNGAERATLAKSGTIQPSSRPLLVGGNANTANALAATETLNGRVDDLRLYTRALSPSEISALTAGVLLLLLLLLLAASSAAGAGPASAITTATAASAITTTATVPGRSASPPDRVGLPRTDRPRPWKPLVGRACAGDGGGPRTPTALPAQPCARGCGETLPAGGEHAQPSPPPHAPSWDLRRTSDNRRRGSPLHRPNSPCGLKSTAARQGMGAIQGSLPAEL